MASDADKSSKTEMPTSKRLFEAYDDGNFAKAPELGVVAILVASFGYLSLQGPALAIQVGEFSKYIFSHLHQFDINPTSAGFLLPELMKAGLFMILPFIAVCCAAAILAGGYQTGFRIANNVLRLDFGRINIVNGLQSLFSPQKLVNFVISLLKFIVVAWIISGVLMDIRRDPIFYTQVSVQHVMEFIFNTFMAMLARLILAIGAIAALSYGYQKYIWTEGLKMTKQEVKDEMKNSEGDPAVKGARKKAAFRAAYRQILTKVPLADVVVTNPTHFAVALKYERGRDSAPVVVAKGKDLLAQRIKQIARKHDVPMVENRPVARALYKQAAVGKAIPGALFQAVAQILAFVYRAHRYYFHRLKARRLEAQV